MTAIPLGVELHLPKAPVGGMCPAINGGVQALTIYPQLPVLYYWPGPPSSRGHWSRDSSILRIAFPVFQQRFYSHTTNEFGHQFAHCFFSR